MNRYTARLSVDIRRQRNEAQAHDSQGGPLHPFTPGVVKIVVEPPEQCRPECHFDDAVQSEADQGDGPDDCPGDNRDQPSRLLSAMVKYSSCWPLRSSALRFDVVVVTFA